MSLAIQSDNGGLLPGVPAPLGVSVGVVLVSTALERLWGGGKRMPSVMRGLIGGVGRGPPAVAEDMMFWMFWARRLMLPEDMGGCPPSGMSVVSDWVGVASPCKHKQLSQASILSTK